VVRRINTEKRLGFANQSLVSRQLGEVDGTSPSSSRIAIMTLPVRTFREV